MAVSDSSADRHDAEKEALSSAQHAAQLAGEFMGFGALLRRWRKAAGVTQLRAARALGMGERTYRKIERGATPPRFSRPQCEALAAVFELDRDERHALLLYNVGTSLEPSDAAGHPELRRALRLLMDRQMPSPSYLTDRYWNIIGFNTAMAEWWPWVMEPGANLIRWALTSTEARTQFHDWRKHAAAYVKILKFALATKDNDEELRQLIDDVQKDPDVRHIWETQEELSESRDGHIFRMNVPALGWEPVEVVSHVLYPASMPDCRFVVITWVELPEAAQQQEALDDEGDATASAGGGLEHAQQRARERASEANRRRKAHALTDRLVVDSAEEAARLAGEEGIPLPVLSKLMGPDCQLTLSPSQHSVIWAIEEAPGEWAISQVDAYAVAVRIPRAALIDEARAEMKLLTRAVLPVAPDEAVDRIQQLLPQLEQRIVLLREIWRDLHEQDPSLPYIWEPADEV
ncbi:helix-turn-helix domain-containing protein [Streptomyces sp. TRM66268-LWL]|uniref:Helix-turn-helix domain-containing protein n=1 Tax=Streptomyces polyasparticus TaxID=2767826 RepID=A0ABR7SSD9_9ACTN|nr:helix-turn-helix transcriptional regulator [Streptomyces polyasparticus]MBC9718417.1 helix-turn-helix domain-containing protein [Streptomyces polyasparticus]